MTPQPAPIPPSPDTSAALLAAFAERGISFHPNRALKSADPARQAALFDDGGEMPYDLLFAAEFGRSRARRWFGKEWAT